MCGGEAGRKLSQQAALPLAGYQTLIAQLALGGEWKAGGQCQHEALPHGGLHGIPHGGLHGALHGILCGAHLQGSKAQNLPHALLASPSALPQALHAPHASREILTVPHLPGGDPGSVGGHVGAFVPL